MCLFGCNHRISTKDTKFKDALVADQLHHNDYKSPKWLHPSKEKRQIKDKDQILTCAIRRKWDIVKYFFGFYSFFPNIL